MGLIESDIGQVIALNHLTISISINFILSLCGHRRDDILLL